MITIIYMILVLRLIDDNDNDLILCVYLIEYAFTFESYTQKKTPQHDNDKIA